MSIKMGPGIFLMSLFRLMKGRSHIPASLEKNELIHVILNRRSIRSFTGKEIPADVFATILEAGRVAPSTVNLQTWSFAVFSPDDWKKTFGRTIPFKAGRAVIILADTFRLKQVMDVFPYCPLVEYTTAVLNASLAAMNMTVAAEAMGVSSVMLSETGRTGLLDVGYLKKTLDLPDGVTPLTTIVFGYANGIFPPMPPRLPVEAITFCGTYPSPEKTQLQEWMGQMEAGYKASHPGSSFDHQVEIYKEKIGQAEADLQRLVFYRERKENV
jgi:nitroreductase